ncbi:hypothetical protein LEN26_002127 [Aphanomyces euteiches]|nr:hypothetical protein AeMF1_007883 [Aphanomyces euteiches]KAH9119345.1 hypothetical protein AeMF1_007881 [Aphanomyces euteiches]KAH9122705.1 hypothetical protein AeMF1_006093 [Aphanomyces euteiches]KAH9159882.1 hypothetical protein LEN26_002127 [Aphanomyces euteiches]KAH9184275.1 hypothetical protein AeNC1_013747 [Aphanomyces euteiches]
MTSTVSVEFDHLEFKYVEQFAGMDISGGPVLRDIHCQMHFGQRILLIGGNGAGKSTLLKMIGGKHLPTNGHCWQLGKRDSFRDTTLNLKRTMASSEWGNRSMAFASHSAAYAADIAVDEMMVKLQESFPERRQELLRCLRIDPAWRMHKLSTGQRCRVQLFLALLRPSQLIVLDEVLGCLDIISRVNLLEFLRRESDGPHRSTVVMASHVFDGMDEWVTHVMYLRSGKIAFFGGVDKVPLMGKSQLSIYHTTQVWLREEEEAPEKEASTSGVLENAQNRAGGFAAGRLGDYEQ